MRLLEGFNNILFSHDLTYILGFATDGEVTLAHPFAHNLQNVLYIFQLSLVFGSALLKNVHSNFFLFCGCPNLYET
jgi:hypothetical protein